MTTCTIILAVVTCVFAPDRKVLSPAEAAAMLAPYQHVPVHEVKTRTADEIIAGALSHVVDRGPTLSPWEFPAEAPRRRLDGTLMSDPPEQYYYPHNYGGYYGGPAVATAAAASSASATTPAPVPPPTSEPMRAASAGIKIGPNVPVTPPPPAVVPPPTPAPPTVIVIPVTPPPVVAPPRERGRDGHRDRRHDDKKKKDDKS